MAASFRPKPSRVRVRDHRKRLRAQGTGPNIRAPEFRAAAHRQSLAVAASADARADQAFIDAISDQGEA